ncbi:hypothetical protein HNQ56_000230 [Anaerotaenia torta]|uniref:hypothetical protein n=1 Tax=Anaerotaenia torta TaxID=433293 RepID=UPI003D1E9CE7
MERGIYFDGWYKNNHCYHPSLPFRSMQMVEDIEKYKGTILVWSALGGGSISLPYLENEAFGELDPRLRFYGFMNDSEFIAECNKRGIKVMGIVFEVQGWEFPVEISEDGKHMKQFNVMREGTAHDYYGLNEFSSGKHEGLFRTTLKDYYPDGIINSDGELVTDLWEEAAARTYQGEPVHAQWVEVTGHSRTCHQTCRNNPVWRDYLKKIIKIQLDAGVAGIQLDEAELPITSLRAGGCFCKDCRKQFRAFLQELRKQGLLDSQYDHIDLENFDYQKFLLEGNYSFPDGAPLFREYYEFQLRAVKKHFIELVDYARDYARTVQNREILVSGNFFNCMPVYFPMEHTVDVIITEMEKTLFQQPYWYRYIAGFSNSKPVIVAENPYGGMIPELLEMLDRGKGYDLYRLFLLEASAYGCNMSVPYGGWMGNTIKDAFYPPRDVTMEVQDFLAGHEDFYSKESGAKILVVYSFPSYYWKEVTKAYNGNVITEENSILFYSPTDITDENTSRLPFWEVIKELSDQQVVYDVKILGDDQVCKRPLTMEELRDYELIILPACDVLTEEQTQVLDEYRNQGGQLLLFGETAANLPGWQEEVLQKGNAVYCENSDSKKASLEAFRKGFAGLNESIGQIKVDDPRIGVHLQKNGGTHTIHLLNYNYDSEKDSVMPVPALGVTVKKPASAQGVKLYTLDGTEVKYSAEVQGDTMKLTIYDMPLYLVIRFI